MPGRRREARDRRWVAGANRIARCRERMKPNGTAAAMQTIGPPPPEFEIDGRCPGALVPQERPSILEQAAMRPRSSSQARFAEPPTGSGRGTKGEARTPKAAEELMGACPKCGKPRVRKNKRRERRCIRCGAVGKSYAVEPITVDIQIITDEVISAPRPRVRWRSTEQGTS